MVADDDLNLGDFDFAMMMSFCKIMIEYIIKKAFLLGKRLVIVTEDGIFLWCFVKLQHYRTLPRPVMFSNVKSCLKLLSLPFSLFSCLSASRPSSNSLYHRLFWIHFFSSLQPCSAITPASYEAAPKKYFLPLAVSFVYPFSFCTVSASSRFVVGKASICKTDLSVINPRMGFKN